MKRENKHRLLAFLLTILMLIGHAFVAPVTVAADEDDLEPGEVRTYKTATPVDGKVNTWDIVLRVETIPAEEPKTADIVLVIDTSGSMGSPTQRMPNAIAAAEKFVERLLPSYSEWVNIAVVSFATNVTTQKGLTKNRQELLDVIGGLKATGGTFTQGAMREAASLLAGSQADYKHIVLLSDGEPTYSYGLETPSDSNNFAYSHTVETTTGRGQGRKTEYTEYYYSKDDLAENKFKYTTGFFGTVNRVGSGSEGTAYISGSETGSGTENNPYKRYYYHHGHSAIAQAKMFKDLGADRYLYTIAF